MDVDLGFVSLTKSVIPESDGEYLAQALLCRAARLCVPSKTGGLRRNCLPNIRQLCRLSVAPALHKPAALLYS